MTSVTPTGGSAITMAYQGLGQARRITDGSASQIEDQLGLEKETGSTPTYYTRDADGTILGERRGTTHYYFLFDGNGSVVSVIDGSGTTDDTFSYDPYGKTTVSGSVYEPIRFDGGYDDSVNGGESLIKFGERYYDPMIGRWTTQDPVDNPLDQHGWNQYAYVGDDPINGVDPTGMSACSKHGWAPKFACHAAKKVHRAIARGVKRALVDGGVGAATGCLIGGAAGMPEGAEVAGGLCIVVGTSLGENAALWGFITGVTGLPDIAPSPDLLH